MFCKCNKHFQELKQKIYIPLSQLSHACSFIFEHLALSRGDQIFRRKKYTKQKSIKNMSTMLLMNLF